jgi:hypothetical protein
MFEYKKRIIKKKDKAVEDKSKEVELSFIVPAGLFLCLNSS